jgi:neutral ceramidase
MSTARTIRAGFSKVDITPPLDRMEVFGLGYWFERAVRFRGIRDPLFVRALAMGDDAECQLILSVDAILDSYGFIPKATARISDVLGIKPENIFVSCTHTHSTPVVGRNGTNQGKEYGDYVARQLVRAAEAGFVRRNTVCAGVSQVNVPNVLYNRRPVLKNGRIAELHAAVDAEAIAERGPVDERLTLLKFRDPDGRLAGAVCHFGIHGVAVQCSELISSDCMGRAIQRAEAEMGAVVVHLNGPCADIDPALMGSDDALETMTERLFRGVMDAAGTAERSLDLKPQRSYPGRFIAQRRPARTAAELRAEKLRVSEGPGVEAAQHHSGRGYALFLLGEEEKVDSQPSQFEIPYQILRTGEAVWIGVGGEIFTSFGMRLKDLDPRFLILPVGLTGTSEGYLPPEKAFEQGGYEVACAQWCPIAPGETEKLFARIGQDAVAVLSEAG